MLVLTRKKGQRIIMETESGEQIVLSVVNLKGGRVRLGIAAPHSISVVREELLSNAEGLKPMETVGENVVSV